MPLLLNKRLNCNQELSLLLPSLLGSATQVRHSRLATSGQSHFDGSGQRDIPSALPCVCPKDESRHGLDPSCCAILGLFKTK